MTRPPKLISLFDACDSTFRETGAFPVEPLIIRMFGLFLGGDEKAFGSCRTTNDEELRIKFLSPDGETDYGQNIVSFIDRLYSGDLIDLETRLAAQDAAQGPTPPQSTFEILELPLLELERSPKGRERLRNFAQKVMMSPTFAAKALWAAGVRPATELLTLVDIAYLHPEGKRNQGRKNSASDRATVHSIMNELCRTPGFDHRNPNWEEISRTIFERSEGYLACTQKTIAKYARDSLRMIKRDSRQRAVPKD